MYIPALLSNAKALENGDGKRRARAALARADDAGGRAPAAVGGRRGVGGGDDGAERRVPRRGVAAAASARDGQRAHRRRHGGRRRVRRRRRGAWRALGPVCLMAPAGAVEHMLSGMVEHQEFDPGAQRKVVMHDQAAIRPNAIPTSNSWAPRAGLRFLERPCNGREVRGDEINLRSLMCASYRLLRAMASHFALMQKELVPHVPTFPHPSALIGLGVFVFWGFGQALHGHGQLPNNSCSVP